MSFDFTKTIIDGIKIWVEKKISSNIHGLASEEYVDSSIQTLSTDVYTSIEEKITEVSGNITEKADKAHTHVWDDINDKPFYSNGVEEKEVFSAEGFFAGTGGDTDWCYREYDTSSVGLLKAGKSYSVIYDGIRYDNIIAEYSEITEYSSTVGSNVLKRGVSLNKNKDDAYPFSVFYLYYKHETHRNEYDYCFRIYLKDYDFHDISIIEIVENVQHIEDKYISDNIRLPQYTTNDENKVLRMVCGTPAWADKIEHTWKTLSDKPFDDVLTNSDTLIIPDNKSGLYVVNNTHYLVANCTPKYANVFEAEIVLVENDTSQTISMIHNGSGIHDDGVIVLGTRDNTHGTVYYPAVYIALEDNAILNDTTFPQITFPKKGIYVPEMATSLKISGYNFSKTVCIDDKYIPRTIKLPYYTNEDEGKFLRIVNGNPTWVTIPNAEDGVF